MKKCSKCKVTKENSGFNPRGGKESYRLRSECKSCAIALERGRNPLGKRYCKYKEGAKTRGLLFKISKEEFTEFWQKPCSYCGSKIETIGLDRVDNSVGYIKENVIPCCSYCNYMKRNFPSDLFIEHCKKVTEFN